MDIFARKGFAAAKTVDVARAAEMSHGSVFVHFPTREHLIVAVIEEFGAQVMRRTHELAAAGEGVRGVLEAHLSCLQENEDFYARLISEAAALPPEARHTLTGIQSAVSQHLFTVAQEGIAHGEIRPMQMHLLFNTWIGLLHYYLSNRDLFSPGESVIETKGDELLTHFLELIRRDET